MRICFLSFYFSPLVGGAETQSERQARQLQALGNDVIVVTLRADKQWKRRELLDGLPVIRVGGLYKRNGQLRVGRLGYLPCTLAMFLTLWRLHHRYDLIHVFQITTLAAAAALIGQITHKPVLISNQSTGPDEETCKRLEHGGMLMAGTLLVTDFLKVDAKDLVTGDVTYLARVALGGKIIINFLRNSKAYFHVNSTRNYTYLTSNGFRVERIVRIPHGVDTEKYQPAADQWSDPEKAERSIICVARLDYAKGIDVLLHAWGRMIQHSLDQPGQRQEYINSPAMVPSKCIEHLKPRLLLVGDGILRPQLERIIADLGIADSVEFLGLRRDIPELLHHSWGFVCPSRWESLPNALLEAMACGLPCVATRVSGSEDILSDGINGLLVEPEQADKMGTALRCIIEDSHFARQLGQVARATIIPDYQLITVVKEFMELYRQLIMRGKK